MNSLETLEIGNSLEAVNFYRLRNRKPERVRFADGTIEEVEPIVVGVAEAMCVEPDEIAIIAGGVRVAHKIGITFETLNAVADNWIETGRIGVVIEELRAQVAN